MEKEEILKGNKLIAKFMPNMVFIEPKNKDCKSYWRKLDADNLPMAEYIKDGLRYHSSWDWLMPVVEKIEKSGCIVEMSLSLGGFCRIVWIGRKGEGATSFNNQDNNLLNCTFQTVIEFIEYFNQHPINQKTDENN